MAFLNLRHISLSVVIIFLSAASALSIAFYAASRKEIKPLGSETSVRANIEAALGNLSISGGAPRGTVCIVEDANTQEELSSMLEYRLNGTTGILSFSTDKTEGLLHHGIVVWNKTYEPYAHSVAHSVECDPTPTPNERRSWSLQFSKEFPLSLVTQIGLGNFSLDLTDVPVENLSVNAGASNVYIQCDKQNSVRARNVSFDVGATKLSTKNLSNLHFDHLRFDGGLGIYTLDFGGESDHDADADIDIGMGTLVIVMPRSIAAEISYDDNWFSSFQLDDCHRVAKGEYVSNNAGRAHSTIHFSINAGAGSVHLKWK